MAKNKDDKEKKERKPSHGETVKGIKKEDRPTPATPEEASKTFPWMGRYNDTLPASLIKHLAMGYSFESFGAVANVGRSTLNRWVKEHPEFAEAKEIGEAKGLQLIEQFGISKVRGKILVDAENKEQFNPKLSDGNMIQFFLKTRFNRVYSEKIEVDNKSSDGSMSPKESKVLIYLPNNGRKKEEGEA